MNAIKSEDDVFFARYQVNYISSSPALTMPIVLQMCVSKDAFFFYDAEHLENLVLYIPHDKIRYFGFVSGTGLKMARKGLFKNFNNGLINNVYKNEMLVDYIDQSNQNAQVQIGMASSILVAHRANDCQQLEQLLRTHGVYSKFITTRQSLLSSNIMSQIQKLAELHKAGVLTDAEFETKKSELLKRI